MYSVYCKVNNVEGSFSSWRVTLASSDIDPLEASPTVGLAGEEPNSAWRNNGRELGQQEIIFVFFFILKWYTYSKYLKNGNKKIVS